MFDMVQYLITNNKYIFYDYSSRDLLSSRLILNIIYLHPYVHGRRRPLPRKCSKSARDKTVHILFHYRLPNSAHKIFINTFIIN